MNSWRLGQKQFFNILLSISILAISILACSFASPSSSQSPLPSQPQSLQPSHYGVFFENDGELIELQEQEISFDIPVENQMGNVQTISASQPTIIIWRSNTNLDYLDFLKLNQYLGQSKNSIRYNATPKEDRVIEITPVSPLDNGIYCLIQGDPLAVTLPGWCFRIGEASNNLPAPTNNLSPSTRVVYFLTGHGEQDIEQGSETSLTRAKATLESKNYAVKTLNLLVENAIPEDASVIVIAGPLQPVTQDEVDLLKAYLANGGSLIVMSNPTGVTEFSDQDDPIAEMLATDWGITLNNDIVIDLNSPQPTTPTAALYDSHPITTSMNDLVSFYPFTRSMSATGTVEGVTVTSLVQTNERSWGETNFEDLQQGGQVGFDESIETLGPLTLAMAGENTTTGGRVVVFGTSLFAADQIFDQYGNGDMFVNSIDWAIGVRN